MERRHNSRINSFFFKFSLLSRVADISRWVSWALSRRVVSHAWLIFACKSYTLIHTCMYASVLGKFKGSFACEGAAGIRLGLTGSVCACARRHALFSLALSLFLLRCFSRCVGPLMFILHGEENGAHWRDGAWIGTLNALWVKRRWGQTCDNCRSTRDATKKYERE